MTIKIYYFFIICFLFSCKKDKKGLVDNSITHKVTFNISGFSTSITHVVNSASRINSVAADSVTDLSTLYYLVYNSSGALVHQIRQDSSQSNFGSITDNLSTGTYTVVIVAGESSSLTLSSSSSGLTLPKIQCYYNVADVVSNYFWYDTFYKKLTLTVSNTNISQSIVLRRVVGKLELNIEDAFPANVKTVTYTFKKEYPYFDLSTGAADSVLRNGISNTSTTNTIKTTITLPASDIGKTNVDFDHIVLNTANPLTVTITCYDATSAVIGQAIINNVTIVANEKTILSGKLFGNSNDFTVNLDPSWGTNPTTIDF